MTGKTELAWAAAFLESEGSVFIRRSGASQSLTPVVVVNNTELLLIQRWYDAIGRRGSFHGPRRKVGSLGTKPSYRVIASFRKAEDILEMLIPHMTPGTSKYLSAQQGLALMRARPRQKRHLRSA